MSSSTRIIVGLLLTLGMGLSVYTDRQISLSSQSAQIIPPNTPSLPDITNVGYEDDDEDEDDDDKYQAPQPTTTQPQTSSSPQGITLAQVATHNSRSSCWTVIGNGVYDLTSWIPNHPGGEQAILSLCGKNGSTGFSQAHSGQSKPASVLIGFKVGTLAP